MVKISTSVSLAKLYPHPPEGRIGETNTDADMERKRKVKEAVDRIIHQIIVSVENALRSKSTAVKVLYVPKGKVGEGTTYNVSIPRPKDMIGKDRVPKGVLCGVQEIYKNEGGFDDVYIFDTYRDKWLIRLIKRPD